MKRGLLYKCLGKPPSIANWWVGDEPCFVSVLLQTAQSDILYLLPNQRGL